jgi:hypothetical protein
MVSNDANRIKTMAKKKKKIRRRKRKFNQQTREEKFLRPQEGKLLAEYNQKLFDAFPDKADRTAYLQACIKEFDRLIEESE